MNKIIIRHDPMDLSKDVVYCDVLVGDFLYGYFKKWPRTAVIYKGHVRAGCEIPVKNKTDVSALNDLTGRIYVVIYPEGFALVGIGLIAATVGINLASKSKNSASNTAASTAEENKSSNNSLSDRANTSRLGGRIPDIFGTIRATPDLIAQPYRYYDDNREVEHSFLCLGRGSYSVSDIRQDETKTKNVSKNLLEIYGPFTSPNFGEPQYREGVISEEFIETKKIDGFSGQTLIAPNQPEYQSSVKTMRIVFPVGGQAYLQANDIDYDLTEYYADGGTIELTTAQTIYIQSIDSFYSNSLLWEPLGTGETLNISVDINGTYTIDTVTKDTITLDNPAAVNPAWTTIATHLPDHWLGMFISEGSPPSGKKAFKNVNTGSGGHNTIIADSRELAESRIIGPVIVDYSENVLINFSADSGLYLSGNTADPSAPLSIAHLAASVDVRITYQLVDANDVPFGSTHVEDVTITSDGESRNKFGYTHRSSLPFAGRMCIKIERTSDTPINVDDQIEIQDEIAIESLYTTRPILNRDFGNVTTIRAISYAGKQSTGSRKLNMTASRLIPVRVSGTTFTTPQATSSAADIIVATSLDSKIGNRTIGELDLDSIYDTVDDVTNYFGSSKASEFNGTFDNDNLSFEETLSTIAETVFCSAYRQSETIKLFFEKIQESSTLLFNHRNKIPGTELRTVNFGTFEDKDGVEIEYSNSIDGKPETIYLPTDQSSIDPEKITFIGVVNKLQAHLHSYRLLNRQLFQTTTLEFDALEEAMLLVLNERIQVADNTRAETFDGEVIDQDALTLTLSQDFEFQDGKNYTIFLQNPNGVIQSIPISPGTHENQIVLATATSQPLSTDPSNYARATYEIVENSSTRKSAFLVAEKSPKDGMVTTVRAINYEDRYYQNDTDYLAGLIGEDGESREDWSLVFPVSPVCWWRFESPPAPRTNVTVEYELLTTDATGFMLLASGTNYVWATKQFDFNTQLNNGAGSPVVKIDEVIQSPANRDAAFNLIADGQWHTVRLENLDLSAWANCGNLFGSAGWYYAGRLKNFKIDWSSDGNWDNEAIHSQWDGFTVGGPATIEKDT